MPKFRIIDPVINSSEWAQLSSRFDRQSPFLSSGWAKTLTETYGYKPLYFALFDGDRCCSIIPLMEVNSILTGKRAISLPFSDFSYIYAESAASFKTLMDHVINYGKEHRWKRIELRCGSGLLDHFPEVTGHIEHTIDMDRSLEQIYADIKPATRRNIRKAEQSGLEISDENSYDNLKAFIRLNSITRKRHGLPPQPARFFKNLYKNILSCNGGRLITASWQGTIIAGAVFLHEGDEVVFKYGASDKRFQHLRANNAVMWQAISRYHAGSRRFSFGRSSTTNHGLLRFKDGWTTQRSFYPYYTYDISAESYLTKKDDGSGLMELVLQHIPVPLLQLIGSTLYRHVA